MAAALVACVDAVRASSAAGVDLTPTSLWLACGLILPLGLLIGLGLAVLLWLMPFDARPAAVWQGLRRGLGAHGPAGAQASATLLVCAALGVAYVALTARLALFFVTRFHNLRLTVLSLALALLALTVLLVLVGVRARDPLRRGLQALPQALRRPATRPITWVGLGAIATLVGLIWALGTFRQTIEAIRFGPLVGTLAIVLGGWSLSGLLPRLPVLRRARFSAALVGAALAVSLTAVTQIKSLPHQVEAAYALTDYSGYVRLLIGPVQRRLDADGDGIAAALGGGDCDDGDADVHPGAAERPNNDVDEDCSGADLVIVARDDFLRVPVQTAFHGPEPPVDPVAELRRPWNIVLITIDTLRPDHLGYNGYERSDISPTIDALAARSVDYQWAYAPSAKTPTSVPPLLASRWPSEMPRTFNHFVRYRDETLFLAEVLQQMGVSTAASVSHWYFRRRYNFDQGFDEWEEYWVAGDRMERVPTSEQVTDNAIALLEAHHALESQDVIRPLFLWVHYFDPHKLYIEHESVPPYGSRQVDHYDGEIRFVDQQLARFFDVMDAQERWQDTVVILTSDHGEAFGEHDMRHHGWDLYEHQIRVPLLIYVPGVEPARYDERVSLMDLAPTITDLLGIAVPESFRGISLLDALAHGVEPPRHAIFTEMPPGPYNSLKRSFTLGDWKLIFHASGNRFRLFNLAEDPGELTDLWESEPEQAERMRQAYELFMATEIEPVRALRTTTEP